MEQEERRPWILIPILPISSHMVLNQLIHFFWISVSSSVNTIQIELEWYYLLTGGQRDVYVLHSKGQTDGIILDWRRMCRSRAFVSHINPMGSGTLLCTQQEPKKSYDSDK